MSTATSFRLRKIKTKQFATIDETDIVESKIQLDAGIGFSINSSLKVIGCSAKFEFKSAGIVFLLLEVVCEFDIKPETWDTLLDDSSIKFPLDLVRHLAVITVGTARGILHAKTEDSIYNKYFLPPVDVTQIVVSDEEFKLEAD